MKKDIREILSAKRRSLQPSFTQLESCLELYWQGEGEKALDALTVAVCEGWEEMQALPFYRLWIEILAERKDLSSLKELAKHCFTIGRSSDNPVAWAGLRGLIHLERDEMEACALLRRSLRGQVQEPYALEFEQRHLLRLCAEGECPVSLLRSDVAITDYFTLVTLARGLLIAGDLEGLHLVLNYSQSLYPRSPLRETFEATHLFEQNSLAFALGHVKKLRGRFPKVVEYPFMEGYFQLCLENYPMAANSLQVALKQTDGRDPDILSLLGYCMHKMSVANNDQQHAEKAVEYLRAAEQALRESGMPFTEVRLLRNKIQQGASSAPRKRENFWLLRLPPRLSQQLADADETDIEYLCRSLGRGPRKGDLMVCAGQTHGAQMRIIAIFRVVTNPVWHPLSGSHTGLELFFRPSWSPSLVLSQSRAPDFSQLGAHDIKRVVDAINAQGNEILKTPSGWTVNLDHRTA